MTEIKIYTATIEVVFEAYEKENPRLIAKHMAEYFNFMRGANLYSSGELISELGSVRLVRSGGGRTISKVLGGGRWQRRLGRRGARHRL